MLREETSFAICGVCRLRPATRTCDGTVEREGKREVCGKPLYWECAGKIGEMARCRGCR